MTPQKARPKRITEYIEAAPNPARKKLREMRACIRLLEGIPVIPRGEKMDGEFFPLLHQ